MRQFVAVAVLAVGPVSFAHGSVSFRVIAPPNAQTTVHQTSSTSGVAWRSGFENVELAFVTDTGDSRVVPITSLDTYLDNDSDGYGDADELVVPGDPRSFQSASAIARSREPTAILAFACTAGIRIPALCEPGRYCAWNIDNARIGGAQPGYVGSSCDIVMRVFENDPAFGTRLLAETLYSFHLAIPQASQGWGDVNYVLSTSPDGQTLSINASVTRLPGFAPALIDLSDQVIGFSVTVPSPGGAAVLALGGLLAARRRRV